jgi:uncharacterized membrane protein YwaF
MHIIKIIFVGLLICAAVFLLARLWQTDRPLTGTALGVFIVIWIVVSVGNLWIGVYRAGYSMATELPILAIVFGVPAAISLAAALAISRL